MEFIVEDVSKTMEFGEKLGSLVQKGDIICLTGDLGTGKTHLVKGFAKGLGIQEHITSPTFTIVNEYNGRLKLYHFDVYRVADPDEVSEIGFDEYIFDDAVSIIEWANYISSIIPDEHIDISLSKISELGDCFRRISISYKGERYSYVKELSL